MATLLSIFDRPKTAPFGLLATTTSILVAQLALLVPAPFLDKVDNILLILAIIPTVAVIAIILCMPLRSPESSKHQISPVYEKPTYDLRSPEDSLTLWQFMSVSWMSPLISLGSTRQLNEEDVWSLSFEFQHRPLHDRFREMRGSVVRRLLAANGLDLVFISILGVLESLASTDDRPSRISEAKADRLHRIRRASLVTAITPRYGRSYSASERCCRFCGAFADCSTCCNSVFHHQSLVQ